MCVSLPLLFLDGHPRQVQCTGNQPTITHTHTSRSTPNTTPLTVPIHITLTTRFSLLYILRTPLPYMHHTPHFSPSLYKTSSSLSLCTRYNSHFIYPSHPSPSVITPFSIPMYPQTMLSTSLSNYTHHKPTHFTSLHPFVHLRPHHHHTTLYHTHLTPIEAHHTPCSHSPLSPFTQPSPDQPSPILACGSFDVSHDVDSRLCFLAMGPPGRITPSGPSIAWNSIRSS